MMELKPCPFCGAKPIISQRPISETLYVECVNRKCKIKPSTEFKGWKNIYKHIAAWNKRIDDN
ncbi:MAG: Lar family restriction alleviation protein [Clostridia bacterium]|nr:Lar family restriction alleviation protein [Clostridia bacterium]